MFTITYEEIFLADYKRVTRQHPFIKQELIAAVRILAETGKLPDSYRAHMLTNSGGTYTGHIDFHLSDGLIDVVVLYLPHKTNPTIRFVRMGTHSELFQGSCR